MIENNRPKILVSAYACEPNTGSEPGVGWHWILEMSKYFELWVITRNSNKREIELWLQNNPVAHINFLYYDPPKWLTFWKKKMRGVRLYYSIWQLGINPIVKRTMNEKKIQIFHHLTYGNALLPISIHGQNYQFIWGPIGGVDSINKEFTKHYGIKSRLVEYLRRKMINLLSINIFFFQKCKKANLILCKTESMFNSIPKKYQMKAVLCTDVAVDLEYISQELKDNKNRYVEYLTVGRLDAWRGFDLLIEAFAKAVIENPNIRLRIIGKGTDKKRLENLIRTLNMEQYITLEGQVPIEEYREKMSRCDVVVNPCLKEGAVTTAFDALTYSKPLICIDTGGYTKYFQSEYAIVISKKNREQIILDLFKSIVLLSKESVRKQMSMATIGVKESISWEKKGDEIQELIHSFL